MTIDSAIQALLPGPAVRICRGWRIQRTDGRVKTVTDHSRRLRINREWYTPTGLAKASALEQSLDTQTHDVELSGLFRSDLISEDDLRASRYDEAEVIVYSVDWMHADVGVLNTSRFWIDGVEWTREGWKASCSGFSRFFERVVGSVIGPDCGNTLGDRNCKVDLSLFATDVVEVTSLPVVDSFEQSDRRVFASSSVTGAGDGYYAFGAVRWIDGPNKGIISAVQQYASSSGRFSLQQRLPFPITVGDQFLAVAGCDRQPATCKNKFNNVVNGRFFEYLRGTPGLLLQVT